MKIERELMVMIIGCVYVEFFISMNTLQVEERSHKIWGGEEGLEEEHQNKIERREKKKEKKYAKEIKREPLGPMSNCTYMYMTINSN